MKVKELFEDETTLLKKKYELLQKIHDLKGIDGREKTIRSLLAQVASINKQIEQKEK